MGLRTRFALQFAAAAAVAVAVAVGASLALFSLRLDGTTADLSRRFAATLEARLRAEGERALDAAAAAAGPALLDYDRMALARIALESKMETSAVAVRIYDGFGRALADGDGDPSVFERPAPPALRGLTDASGVRRWREGDRLFSGRALCVGGDCLGAIAVAVDGSDLARANAEAEAALQAAKDRFWWEAGGLGLGGVLVGAALAALIGALLARRFLRTLQGAIAALGRVASGETDIRVEADDAQLAELAQAVDQVAEAMAAAKGDDAAQTAIIADMADGLFVARLSGELAVANPALHEMLGAPPGALIGADAFDTLGAARVQGAEAMARAFAAVRELRRLDGTAMPVMLSAKATDQGVETQVIGVAREAGEQAAASAALSDATLRAEAAEKAKSEFLSVMSHELRTPLNGVLGGAAVLAGTELDEAQRGFLGIVQESGKSLLSRVNDMLDFSKAEPAPDDPVDEFDRSPTDLEQIAQEIARGVAREAARKDLDLYVRVTPGAPIVMTDGEKLLEIGAQLADNAVKFTDDGHVGIEIAQTMRADGRAEITLSVDDSGPGVPPDKRDSIFDPFSQADSSAERAHGGTGLGLSIAKKLAEQLGGEIAVDTATDGGSTFRVTFPAPVAEDGAPPAREELTGMRALVVEATPGARDGLAEQLGWAGADTAAADTPQAAAAALRRAQEEGRPFDLVVMPETMMDAPGASEFKDWIMGDGWSSGVASVVLRPENAPLTSKQLPQRMQTAPWPAPTGALIDAAAAATKAAGVKPIADGGPPKPKAAEPEPEREEARVEGVAEPEKTPRILLADANEVNRIVLSAFLGKAGYDCVLAENGRVALDLFRANRPTLVLMDVGMAEMTGIEAAKAMRRVEKERGDDPAPIIGLVGKIRESERERCAQAGINDFLAKPVKTAELEAKLERWTTLFGGAEPKEAAAG